MFGARVLGASLAVAGLVAVTACEEGPLDAPWCSLAPPPDVASPVAEPTYTEHVAPLLARKCARCHVTDGLAPFPLTTYADVRTQLDEVRDAVVRHTMPPFLADDCCRPYRFDPSLTDAEIALVVAWIAAGSPEGPPMTPAPVPPEGGLSRTDLVLEMPEGYDTLLNTDLRREGAQFARFLHLVAEHKHKMPWQGRDLSSGAAIHWSLFPDSVRGRCGMVWKRWAGGRGQE